jgi:uncharacterized membrane protein
VRVPQVPTGQLWHALGAEWPTYAAYVASFLTIGIMWINHHAMFERIVRADRLLLLFNLLLLMAIVLLPFPTELMGQFIPKGGPDAVAAATVYGALAVTISIFYALLWTYALRHPELLIKGFDAEAALRASPQFLIGFVIYLAALPLAQFSPIGVVFLLAAAAIYYAFERLPEIES